MRKSNTISRLVLSLALIGAAVFAAECGQAAAPIRVTVSQTGSDQSPWHKGCLAFADYLNEKSGGKYKAQVFPNASLSQGNYTIMMEQMQTGALQVAVEALGVLSAYNEKAGILSMPFTFADIDHVLRFLELKDPTWEGFMKDFEQANLVILAVSPRPMRQLNNNIRLIKKVEDMANIKFRVPANPMYVSIFEALGAKPVPAPSSEIYTGIQLGTFNGEDNSVQFQYDFKTFEVAKNLSIINYIGDISFIFMNKDFYYNAPEEDRKLFHEAAREFVKTEVEANKAYYDVALEGARKLNVQIYEVPEEAKLGFREKLAPFYKSFQSQFSQAELDAFFDAVKRTAP